MELSVIIVNFNVRDLLRQCLHSVMSASENLDCEVFVVDNNSQDGSAEMIQSEFPNVKLIINLYNAGFSAANNQAIIKSSGKFILILNPDTIVQKDTFSKCIEFMNLHPDAGAVGIRMLNGDGTFLPESKRAFPTAFTAFFKAFGISSLFPGSPFLNRYYLPQIETMKTSLTEVIAGAFMFIRKTALMKSGLFDEDYFMYGEDIDLSYRLLQTEFKNYYYPDVHIVHFKGKCTPRNNYTDILHFYNAMQVYVKKRVAEGKYGHLRHLISAAIYLRESLALLNRFFRLTFGRHPKQTE
jgi:GT2 family glycosyltransferase